MENEGPLPRGPGAIQPHASKTRLNVEQSGDVDRLLRQESAAGFPRRMLVKGLRVKVRFELVKGLRVKVRRCCPQGPPSCGPQAMQPYPL